MLEDDDSVALRTLEVTHLPASDVSSHEPWLRVIGAEIIWAWVLTNQFGFEDGVQMLFLAPDGRETCIELMAAASRFQAAIVTDVS